MTFRIVQGNPFGGGIEVPDTDLSGYYTKTESDGRYKASAPQAVSVTRDGSSLIQTIAKGSTTYTVTRSSGQIASISNGVWTKTINRTNGLISGVTVS